MKSVASLLRISFTLLALPLATFAKPGWLENYDKGLEQAKKENKIALLDFTGSDWCSWCMKLDKEVFSQAKFKEYAKANLVLVEIDFPQIKRLPKSKQEKHDALAQQFEVQGFPSVILLNADGSKLGRLGYQEGGAEAFIASIEKLRGAPAAAASAAN